MREELKAKRIKLNDRHSREQRTFDMYNYLHLLLYFVDKELHPTVEYYYILQMSIHQRFQDTCKLYVESISFERS